ncbi:MAG: gluconate 2-dehydrogenase subunit 3 family protein [Bacteroidetes bacterium]|nr:gluconate 2-dehydrogenase subunit 3 family protein [Bacteroidota bacterium]
MNRREALRAVSFLMGGAVIGAELFLTGCDTKRDEKQVNKLFSDSDVALLDEVGDTIIPETDTPGAKAVGIGSFMAMMVLDTYPEKDQEVFQEGLEKLRSGFEEEYDKSFIEASAEERKQYLTKLNKELEMPHEQKEGEPEHYFRMIKQLTLLGYFSSEIGSTKALRYIETPGRYEACIPYEKGQRAWAI